MAKFINITILNTLFLVFSYIVMFFFHLVLMIILESIVDIKWPEHIQGMVYAGSFLYVSIFYNFISLIVYACKFIIKRSIFYIFITIYFLIFLILIFYYCLPIILNGVHPFMYGGLGLSIFLIMFIPLVILAYKIALEEDFLRKLPKV